MIFLAVGGVDIVEGVFHLVGGGGDQTVAPLVQICLTIKKVSGECDDLRHDFNFSEKRKLCFLINFGKL